MVLIIQRNAYRNKTSLNQTLLTARGRFNQMCIEKQQVTTQHEQKVKKKEELLQKTQRIKQKTLP